MRERGVDDTRWLVVLATLGRGCIIGLAAACLLGLLGGVVSMWPDVDHLPRIVATLFPEVYGDLASVSPRFLHLVFFRFLVGATVVLAAFAAGCAMAVIREMRRADDHTGGTIIMTMED